MALASDTTFQEDCHIQQYWQALNNKGFLVGVRRRDVKLWLQASAILLLLKYLNFRASVWSQSPPRDSVLTCL